MPIAEDELGEIIELVEQLELLLVPLPLPPPLLELEVLLDDEALEDELLLLLLECELDEHELHELLELLPLEEDEHDELLLLLLLQLLLELEGHGGHARSGLLSGLLAVNVAVPMPL